MRRNSIWLASVIFMSLIQTMWPDSLAIQGVKPDLVLLLVVYFALIYGEERAMMTGLIGGLYQDVASGAVLGHHVLCHVVIGYIVGRLSTRLITDHPAIRAGVVLFAGIAHGALYTSIAYIQRPDISITFIVALEVIPAAFYTAVLTPVVYWLLEWTTRKPSTVSGGLI